MRMLACALLVLQASAGPQTGTWRLSLEPNHSSVRFTVPIAGGLTKVSGAFASAEVTIEWDGTDAGHWTVEATIAAASIDTNNDERDADLRGPQFFDAAAHPRITFRSRSVRPSDSGYVADGDLTIRGVTRRVSLPFAITGTEWHEERPILGLAIRWQLDRLDYGVGADWRHSLIPNFIGRDVSVEIDLWTRPGRRRDESPGP